MKPVKAWKNAKVITMDENCPQAEAFAADQEGNLVFVGTNKELDSYITQDTVVEDLHGMTVTPGFIESHCHPAGYGQSLLALNVQNISKEEILSRVAKAVSESEPGKWLVAGMGFNNEIWDDPSYPTKEELDAVAPNTPVIIPRMDGHLIWVNSKAFEVCDITRDTPNPEGGEFFRTSDGELQGCCADAAMEMIRGHVPPETVEELQQDLLAAQKDYLSKGVTVITDMSAGLKDIEAVEALLDSGAFKLRYYGGLFNFTGKNAGTAEREFLKDCPKIGLHNDHFTLRMCKFLGDGAVGAQTAHMKDDYADRPGWKGLGMYTDQELYEAFKEAADQGMQITIHSIGDATVEQVLRTYRRLLEEKDYGDHRWRVEHFQTITSDTPNQAAQLHVIPSMQPMHAPNSAEMAKRRLGPERIHGAYAPGLVLKSTGMVALGSDAPVANPSPLSGMHAAVTRTNDKCLPEGGFCMENAITPEDAMKGYTVWGAYTMFAENRLGSLTPGKHADFVVLDQDPLQTAKAAPDDLLKIKVLKTYIDGCCCYQSKDFDAIIK